MTYGNTLISDEALAKLARWNALEYGNVSRALPDDVEVKSWEIIDNADFSKVEKVDDGGRVRVWLIGKFERGRQVASKTFHHPAEYEYEEHYCSIGVTFDVGEPQGDVFVDIEIE